MSKRILTLSSSALLAAGVAACGSSSKAPGIVPAPSGGATHAVTTTTATVPPALSKQPVVTVPKTPPPSHLVAKDLIQGTGRTVQPGQNVTVNYVGVLYKSGRPFDSSWSRNQPLTTPLSAGSIIQGWVQGIPGMKVGGRRELIIPPADAYGKRARSGIPPNSTLVFVVDLLSVS